jgi:long-chain acyl-CoA synthetase
MNTLPETAATLSQLVARRLLAGGAGEALWIKAQGAFVPVSWKSLREDVLSTARLLQTKGLVRGDRVAVVSENRYEWILADLSLQLLGAVNVAIHPTLSGSQIAFQIQHCQSRFLLLSSAELVEKLRSFATELSAVERAWCFSRSESFIGKLLMEDFDSGRNSTEATDAESRAIFEQAETQTQPHDLATILYTSGTTGEPKGVMLSHGNLAFNSRAAREAFGPRPDEVRLSWLPYSHIFARTCDLYVWLGRGSRMAVAGIRETLLVDIQDIRPTFLNAVPYFYEKVMEQLIASGKQNEPDVLHALLGGRIRFCCSGGAALREDVEQFFNDRGLELMQGYGLTETSPVISMSYPGHHHQGTVGPILAGVEVRLDDQGEIHTRGPHVMLGYWRDRAATEQIIHDGWLATGDLGTMEDGYLRITGRKKELIVSATGEKIVPSQLEALLTADPLIAQAVVVGEGKKFLAALIVPQREALIAEIAARHICVSNAAEAVTHPEVRAIFAQRIAERLSERASFEQVREFVILPRGFTVESGELTPKLSLRRGEIARHCADLISHIYGS